MLVQIDTSALRRAKWHEYAIRFFFGGLITAAAGIIARHFGPAVGGLFLAFPAIFPAAATLTQKNEKEKKQQRGLRGEQKGISAAAAESAGTVLGSIALLAFAMICCTLITRLNPWQVFVFALVGWSVIAGTCWYARKRLNWRRETPRHAHSTVPPRGH